MARRTNPITTTQTILIEGEPVPLTTEGGEVPSAEQLFRDAVTQANRLRTEADEAQASAHAAEQRAGVAREWHRFAREQYLDRAFYKPLEFGSSDFPWTYEKWASMNRKAYGDSEALTELYGQFLRISSSHI